MAVGNEQDFLVGRDALDDLFGVAGSDDPIGQRFDGGRAVDVSDGLKATAVFAEHLLIASQLVGGAAFRQATASQQVGEQDALFRVQHLGGLRHEVNAAKNDGRSLHRSSGSG